MYEAAPQVRLDTRATGVVAGSPTSSRGKVLVVDDELAVVRFYARVLGAKGYQVFTATDGDTAELIFQRCAVDAVITDLTMPGMDGFSLLRAIRRADRDVPLIVASGERDDASARRAVEEGALMFFVKPVDPRALAQIVDHATLLHRSGKLSQEARDQIEALSVRGSALRAR